MQSNSVNHLQNQKVEICDLKLANKNSTKISNKLNKELCDLKTKFKKEKIVILKEHRAEIKYGRKELGEETKLKIKLEEKLNEFDEHSLKHPADISGLQQESNHILFPKSPASEETLCSICASEIVNYVPKYFLGEIFNPACENCDDTSWISENSSDEAVLEVDLITIADDKPPFSRKGFNNHPTSTLLNTSSSSNCLHDQQCILRQPFMLE